MPPELVKAITARRINDFINKQGVGKAFHTAEDYANGIEYTPLTIEEQKELFLSKYPDPVQVNLPPIPQDVVHQQQFDDIKMEEV